MCNGESLMCVSIRPWPLMRDNSSRTPIGAAGTWCSDWRRLDVSVLIGEIACRLLALVQEAIDSTRLKMRKNRMKSKFKKTGVGVTHVWH